MNEQILDMIDFDDPDLLMTVLDAAGALIVSVDLDGRLIWVNETLERWSGYKAEEILGWHLWDFRVPEEREKARQGFFANRFSDTERRLESRWKIKSGELRSVSWSVRLARDDSGDPGVRVITGIDITRERQLAGEQSRLHQMIDTAPDSMIVIDTDTKITFCNPAACALYRMSPDELIGKSNRMFIPPEEEARFMKYAARLRETREPATLETVRMRGDGTRVPVQLRVSPLYDRSGNLSGFLSLSHDITDRLAAESEAKQNIQRSQRLAELAENLNDPVFFADTEGRIGYVNRACASVYGYEPEELLGQPSSMLRPLDRVPAMTVYFQRVRNSGYPEMIETEALHKSGRRVPVEIRSRGLFDSDGNYIGLAAVIHDLTERKAQEDELRRLANTDPLTGMPNRLAFDQRVAEEISRAARYKHPLALVLCDIDHFKRINDTLGHSAGDQALQAFARLLQQSLRNAGDFAARIGGEEFVVMLAETDADRGAIFAERVRHLTEKMIVDAGGNAVSFTVSLGVAELKAGEAAASNAMRRADSALYAAKTAGRNRVERFA